MKEIHNLFAQGKTSVQIEKIIRGSGYKGSAVSVYRYITNMKKKRKDELKKDNGSPQEMVDRKVVCQLFFQPLEKVRSISQQQFDMLNKEYPCFPEIHDLVWQFREILAGNDPSKLPLWIAKATLVQIPEISSFINGIKQDWQAVVNAIQYPFNNGLAEGNVNKTKVIKRIMYGRCHFDTLRTKVLALESLRHAN